MKKSYPSVQFWHVIGYLKKNIRKRGLVEVSSLATDGENY